MSDNTIHIAELEAEIARLTAINADLCAVNLRHAEAIATADGWREGAEAMREACALIADALAGYISDNIRALPIPSPPAEETKT